ncbi:heme exporter protein D [Pseudoalteromonas ulvae UL12]|uniref:Heme exporter protein D n=1 Tax=Pseudoalteromonas ulvae TaxID=107327 RepID=A0A244CSE8_PSEDV|nr:heme exporter protein CcmD [Pseudoalteromonas ulvae]MBE0363687.1 heme exporter protein D [Pseudoalteromonas ulvae UL12]OUL58534.1 heme exporter protein CcmD [Pseudoalteromonas ulvae]
MQFSSFSEFIAMGGYGFFVWLSYGSCFLLLAGIVVSSILGHKQTLNNIKAQLEREVRIKRAQQEDKA